MRVLLALSAAAALFAQAPPEAVQRLNRARLILAQRREHLIDYTCEQTVDRSYFRHRHLPSPKASCQQIRALDPRNLILLGTDRLRIELKLSHGEEIGSWANSQFTSRSIFELIGAGPYQTGMLGSLISDAFLTGGASYSYTGEEDGPGGRLSEYHYRVPVSASHYQVQAGGAWAPTGFSGSFWLDADSAELRRLTAESHDLPADSGACDFDTQIDYQMMHAGTGVFLLPEKSSMRTVGEDGSETRVSAVFSGCREYHAETTIRFDAAPDEGAPAPAAVPAGPLPPGLSLSLALAEPIDTDTAAAGDLVKAKVRRAVRDPKTKAVRVPAGAIVHLRIVQMTHQLSQPRSFGVALLAESLDTPAGPQPLYAKAERQQALSVGDVLHGTVLGGTSAQVLSVAPISDSPLVAALLFVTGEAHYRVPAGYTTEWSTTVPPPGSSQEKK